MMVDSESMLTVFKTELGWTAVQWQRAVAPRVDSVASPTDAEPEKSAWLARRLTFGHPSKADLCDHWQLRPGRQPRPTGDQKAHVDRIASYAAGFDADLSIIPIAICDRTPFQQSVLLACQLVPRGETLSYARLAVCAGRPRSARAVGNVMANNCLPLLVPCHRIVPTGGRTLGGFSAPGGVATKQRLLELEGVGCSAARD